MVRRNVRTLSKAGKVFVPTQTSQKVGEGRVEEPMHCRFVRNPDVRLIAVALGVAVRQ